MSAVEAVYQGGVFRPLTPVPLAENQHVRLNFQPIEQANAEAWFDDVERIRRRLAERHGVFPDSTLDIAADRAR